MIGVELAGLDKVLERLDGMRQKIQHFEHHDLADEFADWQREDVDRKHADVRRARHGVKTLFRAHSRYEIRRSRLARRRLHYRGRTSTRDVLRAELTDKLIARLDALMVEKLKW